MANYELEENGTAIIRSLIPDTDQVFGESEDEYLFSDEELQSFYTVGRGSWLRAAGFAKLALASSEAYISKKIKTQDLETDGPAVAKELREAAADLFEQADAQDASDAVDFFQIVDFGEGWRTAPPELTEWQTGY